MEQPIDHLIRDIRACRNCESFLPCEPRPVFQLSASARLLIIGQAPGRRAHNSGIPFSDASGDRLRSWLGVDPATFYDTSRIAILPMGFCYPGTVPKGGDVLPPAICATLWHDKVLRSLPAVESTILVGGLAQRAYLPDLAPNMTDTVTAWRAVFPKVIPMPHPSWRNTGWIKRHPWFEDSLLPALRRHVHVLMQEG
jgi:uracil-DNA glycosylase